MRWLVLGAAGRFGVDMVRFLNSNSIDVTGYTKQDLDVTASLQELKRLVAGFDVIVNAATYDDIAAAETNPELAFQVNTEAPSKLAIISAQQNQKLIHISSENVFDGSEAEFDTTAATNPVNNYGRSKAQGERAVLTNNPAAFVVRTSWIYGSDENSFPVKIAERLLTGEKVRADSRERGTPVWTEDLAMFIHQLISTQSSGGIYHGVSQGHTSWFEFAKLIARTIGVSESLVHEKQRNAEAESIRGLARSVLIPSDIAGYRIAEWEQGYLAFQAQLSH